MLSMAQLTALQQAQALQAAGQADLLAAAFICSHVVSHCAAAGFCPPNLLPICGACHHGERGEKCMCSQLTPHCTCSSNLCTISPSIAQLHHSTLNATEGATGARAAMLMFHDLGCAPARLLQHLREALPS